MKTTLFLLGFLVVSCGMTEVITKPPPLVKVDYFDSYGNEGWVVTPIVFEGGFLFYSPTKEGLYNDEVYSSMWCNGQRALRKKFDTNWLRYEMVDYRYNPNGEMIEQIIHLDTISHE